VEGLGLPLPPEGLGLLPPLGFLNGIATCTGTGIGLRVMIVVLSFSSPIKDGSASLPLFDRPECMTELTDGGLGEGVGNSVVVGSSVSSSSVGQSTVQIAVSVQYASPIPQNPYLLRHWVDRGHGSPPHGPIVGVMVGISVGVSVGLIDTGCIEGVAVIGASVCPSVGTGLG